MRKTRKLQGIKGERLPERARSFLRSVAGLANSYILDELKTFSTDDQRAVKRYAMRVLRDSSLMRDSELRAASARVIVALLPESFAAFERFLSDSSTPFWYEAHFTAFVQLDRSDLSEADQSRVLGLIETYLTLAKSQAGFAAWKAGDLLGDEWLSSETVRILEKLLFSAKYVAGRAGALHGIKHAITRASPSGRNRLSSLIRKVAAEDRSSTIRRSAELALEGVGCHRCRLKAKS